MVSIVCDVLTVLIAILSLRMDAQARRRTFFVLIIIVAAAFLLDLMSMSYPEGFVANGIPGINSSGEVPDYIMSMFPGGDILIASVIESSWTLLAWVAMLCSLIDVPGLRDWLDKRMTV